jgi:hypothetical protein
MTDQNPRTYKKIPNPYIKLDYKYELELKGKQKKIPNPYMELDYELEYKG